MSRAEIARLKRVEMINHLKNAGQSQSDIAKSLGISRQAVSQLLNREPLLIRQERYRAKLKQKTATEPN